MAKMSAVNRRTVESLRSATSSARDSKREVNGSVADSWELGDIPLVVGRGEKAHARVDDREISRQHFQIIRREGKFVIQDRQSRNGTFVNGLRVESTALKPNDQIRAGETNFLFTDESASQVAATLTDVHRPKILRKE